METRLEHIITYGVNFNVIRRFCNTLHVRKDIDIIPLECEVIKTTRKKPPPSERPRKKKKKKPKEMSDVSFHSNTDLDTNATDSPYTEDEELLPFSATSSDSAESSDTSNTSNSSSSSHKSEEFDRGGIKIDPQEELDRLFRRNTNS